MNGRGGGLEISGRHPGQARLRHCARAVVRLVSRRLNVKPFYWLAGDLAARAEVTHDQ